MRHFANDGQSAVAEAAQELKGDGAKRVARTFLVPEVFIQLFLIPASGAPTGVQGGAMTKLGARGVDEGDIL
jgi:hypothetical protein